MKFYYNSRDKRCKSVFGAIDVTDDCLFSVYVKDGVYVDSLYLVLTKVGEEPQKYRLDYRMRNELGHMFSARLTVDDPGAYDYYYEINSEIGMYRLYRGFGGEATLSGHNQYSLTVYDKSGYVPVTNNIVYHIFVDRFARGKDGGAVWDGEARTHTTRSVLKDWNEPVTVEDKDGVFRANDFYGGNLAGIREKLDYLASLGVTHVYLSPIFESWSNHRYDTADYMKIDGLLGDESSYRKLVDALKKRGMRLILDGVFNHTGADSVYFNKHARYAEKGAYQSVDSRFYPWYTFIRYPDDYEAWWGIMVTPTVRADAAAFQEFIAGKGGVLSKWLVKGVTSLRLDVVDELTDDFVKAIRQKLRSICPDSPLIGEVWEDASRKYSYGKLRPYLGGSELDGVMNYVFRRAVIGYLTGCNAAVAAEEIMTVIENYPHEALCNSMTLISTHDTERAINALSGISVAKTHRSERAAAVIEGERLLAAKRKLRLAAALQYILIGSPTVYYGEEIGMQGWGDPLNRAPYAWDKADAEITEHYRALARIRLDNESLILGECRVYARHGCMVVDRLSGGKTLRLVVNNGDINLSYPSEPREEHIYGDCGEVHPQSFAIRKF